MSIINVEIDTDTGRPVDYWALEVFAKVCGVTYEAVIQWIRRDKLDSLKIGRDHYILMGTPKPERKKIKGRHRF